jgi:hypothetical protein
MRPAGELAGEGRQREAVLEPRPWRFGVIGPHVVRRTLGVEGLDAKLEALTEHAQQLFETLNGRGLTAGLDPADGGLSGTGTQGQLALRQTVRAPAASQQLSCIH